MPSTKKKQKAASSKTKYEVGNEVGANNKNTSSMTNDMSKPGRKPKQSK